MALMIINELIYLSLSLMNIIENIKKFLNLVKNLFGPNLNQNRDFLSIFWKLSLLTPNLNHPWGNS